MAHLVGPLGRRRRPRYRSSAHADCRRQVGRAVRGDSAQAATVFEDNALRGRGISLRLLVHCIDNS